MKSDFQNKAEKFWDRSASSYDKEEENDKKTYKLIIEKTKRFLKSTDSVLDLGCGTGLVSNKISKVVKNIDAIDFSSKMVEIAKDKALKLNYKNINYIHTTVFNSQLKTSSYDVILCFYTFHLLENAQETLNRIKKLLKPNGILISATPCMGESPVQASLFSLLNKMGLVPKFEQFKRFDLENLISKNFDIIESECLSKTSNQYYIVAKNNL